MLEAETRGAATLDEDHAWTLIRQVGALARHGARAAVAFRVGGTGRLEQVSAEVSDITIDPGSAPYYRARSPLAPAVAQLLDLYLPVCVVAANGAPFVVGHIGQSLDGQIATASGASRYVTGPESIRHMHRLRALFDAVIVGARTVEDDDPRLTTREVAGDNPTRVVIDPSLRLPVERRLYQDGAAPTLIVCRVGAARGERRFGHAEIVEVEADDGVTRPAAIVAALRARGLTRLFIEGGGITVSRFLAARALDRLHVTVCPIFIGRGRPGILLPPVDTLEQATRPPTRCFTLGADVLFDCQLDYAP